MTFDNLVAILPILISIVALVAQGYSWFISRRKRKLDEASVLTGSAMELVEGLQSELKRVKERIGELETLVQTQEHEYLALLERLEIVEKEKANMQTRLLALEGENRKLKIRISELQLENDTLRQQIKNGKIM